jgi:hypothetical protein
MIDVAQMSCLGQRPDRQSLVLVKHSIGDTVEPILCRTLSTAYSR